MGNRTWATITIGGQIRQSDLDRLVKAIEDEGPEECPDIRTSLVEGEAFLFPECNYGNIDGITTLCEELGLPYVHEWGNCDDYDKGWTYWHPGHGKHEGLNSADNPLIRLDDNPDEARRILQLVKNLPSFTVLSSLTQVQISTSVSATSIAEAIAQALDHIQTGDAYTQVQLADGSYYDGQLKELRHGT